MFVSGKPVTCIREKETMLGKIVVILTMLLSSMVTQLYALELGTVTVESSLNQPLRVQIELLQLGDARLQDIRMQVASNDDFERFNIERAGFLSNVRFSIETSPQGNVVILTTSQIVREPYLSFILETRWPNGHVLSEHTILLNLPVFDDQRSNVEVRQPISDGQIVTQLKPANVPIATTSTLAEPEIQEAETFEIAANSTLSGIALELRPNSSVTMQQTMLAIQQLNPEAFARGNINRLRSGKVLRIPTLEEIEAIDARDAVGEVARQNRDFADTDVQPLAAPSDATPTQEDEPQGQLSVVSSDNVIDATRGSSELDDAENETLDQRIAELETQLVQRQEEADRVRIEREEFDSRMQYLEQQVADVQEIIRLQDIQLAQLQQFLATAAAEAELGVSEINAEEEPEGAGFQDYDSLDFIFMAFGLVLLILLLVVLMLRRNRGAKLDDEIAEQEFDGAIGEAETEFQDYDSSGSDNELDDGLLNTAEDDASEAEDLDKLEFDADAVLDTSTEINREEEGFPSIDDDIETAAAEAPATDSDLDVSSDDAVEFGVNEVNEQVETGSVSTASEAEGIKDDGLEFLPDDDVEIEFIDDAEEMGLLSNSDETATKLELAYAYQNMGDKEGAKEILQEVIKEGSKEQMKEARKLLRTLDKN